jgi:hypothetical protein
MSKLKRSSYIWLAIGLGTLIILGGIFLANLKGLITPEDTNRINLKETDAFLWYTPRILPEHEQIWNDLQQYEKRRDPCISMVNLIDEESKQTRELSTNRYSSFFHVVNYAESQVPVKITLYKNNVVVYEYTLSPDQLLSANLKLGKGKYRLKIARIGEGHCKAKGAITTGIIEW